MISIRSKISLVLATLCLSLGMTGLAQKETSQSFKVLGNCGMCEKTIEKAALKGGASKARWNKESKVLDIHYNSRRWSAEDILKSLAYAGYDNEKYLAPDEAYEQLPECCHYTRTKIKQPANQPQSIKTQAGNTSETDISAKKELEQVYQLYFSLKDALIKDDAMHASSQAGHLSSALDKVNMGKLEEKGHAVFMQNLTVLKASLNKMGETKDLATQRKQFSLVSEKIFELMKAAKPGYPVYLEHCPMFNNGQGANWISKESHIKNPYYGSQMLTCGKVKETIN